MKVFKHHASLWYCIFAPFEFIIGTLFYKYKLLKNSMQSGEIDASGEENVKGKVVVITGANAGIGKSTATEIAKRGAIVVMGCRDLKRGEIARQEIMEESGSKSVELYQLDLSDFSSVRKFATKVLHSYPEIDILINNAGIASNNSKSQFTKEGWDLTMKTNHLGHFLLTKLLVDSISSSCVARVVNVSSTACIASTLDMDDLMMCKETNMGFLGMKPYQNSKLANALFTKALAKQYSSIKTFSLCPGFVNTNIFQPFRKTNIMACLLRITMFLCGFSLKEAAETILLCSLGRKVGQQDSGGFYRFGNHVRGIENMLNDETADKLWNISENLIQEFDGNKTNV